MSSGLVFDAAADNLEYPFLFMVIPKNIRLVFRRFLLAPEIIFIMARLIAGVVPTLLGFVE